MTKNTQALYFFFFFLMLPPRRVDLINHTSLVYISQWYRMHIILIEYNIYPPLISSFCDHEYSKSTSTSLFMTYTHTWMHMHKYLWGAIPWKRIIYLFSIILAHAGIRTVDLSIHRLMVRPPLTDIKSSLFVKCSLH